MERTNSTHPYGDHASIGSGYFPRFDQKGEENRKTIEKFFKDRGTELKDAKKRAVPLNFAYTISNGESYI